ncbi:turripeptide Lol9.1-like [Littorina saxatilis]|uniref:Kazal-like domain-containing protein n=1 Tax=Littorina saxatilis TaxID=31220 RepID=A0AAN9AJN6_9CAEN
MKSLCLLLVLVGVALVGGNVVRRQLGDFHLDCPISCPDTPKPICNMDPQAYYNFCHLMNRLCTTGSTVTPHRRSTCV